MKTLYHNIIAVMAPQQDSHERLCLQLADGLDEQEATALTFLNKELSTMLDITVKGKGSHCVWGLGVCEV